MGKGKYTVRSLCVRIIVNLIGIIITAYGAEAFVLANLGSDPVTAFVQGLGNVLGLPFGSAMNVFNIVFFVIILIVYRKGIGIGTVLYTFLLGTFCTILDPYIVAAIGPGLIWPNLRNVSIGGNDLAGTHMMTYFVIAFAILAILAAGKLPKEYDQLGRK